MKKAMAPHWSVPQWLQEDPAGRLRSQLWAVLKGGLAAFKALDVSRGVYVEKHDRNKMNSWFWEQKGICQYQPRCCLGNCSRWKSRIQNEGWAKWRFSGTQVLQLFRESSASFHSPLRVTLFQNERFGWFGCVSVPWQVFRGSFTTLLPKWRLSCECVQWTF